jgi:hypothetical protein
MMKKLTELTFDCMPGYRAQETPVYVVTENILYMRRNERSADLGGSYTGVAMGGPNWLTVKETPEEIMS